MSRETNPKVRAANKLARILRDYPWYHRTSMLECRSDKDVMRGPFAGWGSYLVVYGEGPRPECLPEDFEGYEVLYEQVSAEKPCVFGSVKSEYRS